MPGKFADLGTHLDLLEEGDHLGLAESGFLHAETPAGGIPYLRVTPVFEVSSDCAWQAIKQKRKNPCKSMTCKGLSVLAERVGFEPTVVLPLRLISSQVHSTTLPPLLVSVLGTA